MKTREWAVKAVLNEQPLWKKEALTIEFLEHALHGAGAAAAGHCDVKLVVVFRHVGESACIWAGE